MSARADAQPGTSRSGLFGGRSMGNHAKCRNEEGKGQFLDEDDSRMLDFS